MPASEAQISANRRNAMLSTGPRTVDGKARSRANNLQHGLTARVLRTPEEIEILGNSTDRPSGPLESSPIGRAWILGEIELLSLRIKRSGLVEMRLQERTAKRAATCWEVDRRAEAEALGSEIHRQPALVASKLEQTPQGCQWMIERWAMLARAADRGANWEPEAESLVFDLLGTPLELRDGPVGESIDCAGNVFGQVETQGVFARRNVARLQVQQEDLAEIDMFDRSTAEAGLSEDAGGISLKLHRQEAALHRRLRWYVNLLGGDFAFASTEASTSREDSPPEPAPVESAVEPLSIASETDHPVKTMTLPPLNRQNRREIRVERRRVAAERKLSRRLE